MNIYLISQTENNGYDTYSEAVVAAPNEDKARVMHPNGYKQFRLDRKEVEKSYDWVNDPKLVRVEFLGIAKDKQQRKVICSSFHAG